MSSSNPDSGRSAFFYGTLMAPAVLHRVCHGSTSPTNPIYATHNLKTYPAVLPNYRRHRVKSADYPAIIPSSSSSSPRSSSPRSSVVRGTYVTGLTDSDIWRLDIFEGGEYKREKVRCRKVLLNETAEDGKQEDEVGEEVEAETYIWISDKNELEEKEWDFEEFKREKMRFWVGSAEREDYAEVDEAVAAQAAANKENDGTRGRGANGYISNALKEEQEKALKAAV